MVSTPLGDSPYSGGLTVLTSSLKSVTLTPNPAPTPTPTLTLTRTPTLTRCEDIDGRVYYWNAALSLAQWEHPQHSYLVGVATRLTQSVTRARRTSGAAAQEAEVRAQV